MGIVKHVEYKCICDGCYEDMTEYIPTRNKTLFVRIIHKHMKIKPFRGKYFCEKCKNEIRKKNPYCEFR